MQEKSVKQRWEKPAIRLGVWTNIVGILLMLLPGLYVTIRYDAWAGWEAFKRAMAMALVYFGVNWFIEPISYYPPVGTVGTYMCWLGGSMTTAKIPAAAAAKDLLDVEDGTQEAEVVNVYAIYGATISNAAILTLIAIFGVVLLSILPEGVRTALSTFVMPALFGSMLAMFGCTLPLLTIPMLLIMVVIYLLIGAGILGIGTTWLPLFSVVLSIVMARVMYKKGVLFKGRLT